MLRFVFTRLSLVVPTFIGITLLVFVLIRLISIPDTFFDTAGRGIGIFISLIAAIALIVAPRDYRYTRNLLASAYARPHIITARAKGLSELRILFWHVVPVAAPQLLALAGVSVAMAVGATVPVEALCGFAGIGQLAWQAALARDLPLLTNITILVTLVTLLANSGADVIGYVLRGQEA